MLQEKLIDLYPLIAIDSDTIFIYIYDYFISF